MTGQAGPSRDTAEKTENVCIGQTTGAARCIILYLTTEIGDVLAERGTHKPIFTEAEYNDRKRGD